MADRSGRLVPVAEMEINFKSALVTLVRVRDGEITFDTTIGGKRAMLANRLPTDLYAAVWTGKYKSDLFEVDIARACTELGVALS